MTKENSWRDVMPRTFRWLDKLQLEGASSLVEGAVHIVPTTCAADKSPQADTAALPVDYAERIAAALKADRWCGRGGSHLLKIDDCYFLLLPLTKFDTSTPQKGRQIGLDAAKRLADFKFEHVVICASELDPLAIFDGMVMGLYDLKSDHTCTVSGDDEEEQVTLPRKVQILGETSAAQIKHTHALARAILITRTLQDSPPNWLTPEQMADFSAGVAEELGIPCKVFGTEELRELGMGAYLSVAQGSVNAPRMIVLEVEGKDPSRKVVLAGKGVTFDSGGISLKPGRGMAEMKYDMSGAAAVLGTLCFLSQEQPPTSVIGLIGAVENMPSSKATRPGDIVTAMNDTSIEILNTDAEGRLVLADLLCYAVKNYQPQLIIDIATLTGAVIHALGQNGGALMSNDRQAAESVLKSSSAVGEPLWQLPLWPELKKEVKGTYSALQNITAPNVKAGTITAAWFLERFVSATPWVHLDVAGTAWNCKATGYPQKGSCAFGLRTMAATCHNMT